MTLLPGVGFVFRDLPFLANLESQIMGNESGLTQTLRGAVYSMPDSESFTRGMGLFDFYLLLSWTGF